MCSGRGTVSNVVYTNDQRKRMKVYICVGLAKHHRTLDRESFENLQGMKADYLVQSLYLQYEDVKIRYFHGSTANLNDQVRLDVPQDVWFEERWVRRQFHESSRDQQMNKRTCIVYKPSTL